jgi:hypothetical protein
MKTIKTLLLFTLLNTTIMAKEIKTKIVIKATPQTIWAILTDFQKYPEWNPFIKSITGEAVVGKKITAKIIPPGTKGGTFHPKVLAFTANKEFRWLGHFLFPGLFDGEHKFELIDNGDGTTTFIQSEKFGGILVGLFKKMLDDNTVDGFNQMNRKLKELAEKS